MEDRVEIARDFSLLNKRNGKIHNAIEEIIARKCEEFSPPETENLLTFDLQSRSFYTFFDHIYSWYIGRENEDKAIRFLIPYRGNPLLAATFDRNPEKELEEYRKEQAEWDQFKEEMDGEPGGKRFLPVPNFDELPSLGGPETLASSFTREVPFYLGHVLGNGVWIAIKKPEADYKNFINEIFGEVAVLQPFIDHREKYVRAILERNLARV
ncbi:Uncharacterised protein [uncultured archaeon]|nr:Uncharacterised protein [uncultured archaeon]